MKFPVRFQRTACSQALLLVLTLAGASPAWADESSLTQLKKKLAALQEANRQQENRIQQLEKELSQLVAEVHAKPAAAKMATKPVIAPVVAGAVGGAAVGSAEGAAPAEQVAAAKPAVPVVNEVPKSVTDIYQEASGFLSGKLSFEPQLTYSHYDTRELRLNGFLALDSIFLGNINLDRLRSDTVTLDLTTRYALTPDWQVSLDVPFVARDASYFSGGAGSSASTASEASKGQGPKVGDVNFGLSYKLVHEDANHPDVVVSLNAKAPTGKAPYGIKLYTPDANNNNLIIPKELPTGNGVWSLGPAVSFVKTLDPAVVFASLSYNHNFQRHFGDISSAQSATVPGEVKLGDSWSYGAGVAFALNDKLSLGMSYSQQMARKSKTRADGGSWAYIPGSDANSATMNLGLTYAFSRHFSMVPNVAIGMTPDAPNYSVSLKFPYTF